MAKIKRTITQNFTTVQNDFLRDSSLGLTERGLLITMLSLPDGWDFSAVGLASIVPDGKAKIYSSLNKLEIAGYLKRSRLYEEGKVVDWLYEFCDQPIFLEKNLLTENRKVEENLVTDFLELENLEIENQQNNKIRTQSNTKELNITPSNQSIYQRERAGQKEKKMDRLMVTEELTSQIEQDIEAEALAAEIGAEDVAFAVDVIAELRSVAEPVVFNKREVSPDCVRRVANAIRREHVEYAFKCIRAQTRPIGNIRGYLRTSLFNAPLTITSHNANVEAQSRKPVQQGSFDTDEFFLANVRRTFGDDFDCV